MPSATNEQDFKKVAAYAEHVLHQHDVEAARQLYRNIGRFVARHKLRADDQRLYDRYHNLIVRLKWLALSFLTPPKAQDLFANHLAAAFSLEDFDLWESFKNVVRSFVFVDDRDVFKAKLRDVLNRSQAPMTTNKLADGSAPTVSNWIKDYVSFVGNQPAEPVKQTQYFTDNINIKKLSPAERDRVVSFFKFYEKLKLSSASAAGFEDAIYIDDGGVKAILKDGIVEKITPQQRRTSQLLIERAESILYPQTGAGVDSVQSTPQAASKASDDTNAELASLARQYPHGSLERRAIEEEMTRLKK